MKLNIDCIRSILIELERLDMGCYGLDSFQDSITEYGRNEVVYTFAKLSEADYVTADVQMDESGMFHFGCVYCMKYAGHQLLDKIRDEKRWGTVKKVLGTVKDYSLSAISSAAEGVTTAAINAALDGLKHGSLPVIGDQIRL